MSEARDVTLAVSASVFPPLTMFLRQEVAEATDKETGAVYEVTLNIGSGDYIIHTKDGPWMLISPRSAVDAYRKFVEEKEASKP